MTVKILLLGYGRMGQMLHELIEQSADLELAGIIDVDNVDELETKEFGADAVIDFSSPSAFPALESFVKRTGTPLVCGATGYENHGRAVKDLSQYAPVIYSENYSVGVNVMASVTAQLNSLLGDEFEVELVETHHRYKKDAPSGTAQLLLRSVDPEGKKNLVYGRDPNDGQRQPGDIGVHSLRGGTVPGEHAVTFYGEDEVLQLTHTAYSRKIFAQGALTMARRLVGKPAGDYTFDELLNAKEQK